MTRHPSAAMLAAFALAACSTAPYQAPVAAFKSSLDAFTTAQTSYSATYAAMKAGAANSINTIALQGGARVLVDTGCVDSAATALKTATSWVGSGGLDLLYAADGATAIAGLLSAIPGI